MSTLTQFLGSGGANAPFEQEYLTSGTFTPSAALLKAGGRVEVFLVAGGGAGFYGSNVISGGDGGQVLEFTTVVSGPVSITIGAGGTGAANDVRGTSGGSTSFGAIKTALGGKAGRTSSSLADAGIVGSSGGGVENLSPVKMLPPGYGRNGRGAGGSTLNSPINGAGCSAIGAVANSGGGGGTSSSGDLTIRNGGSGYCRVRWYE